MWCLIPFMVCLILAWIKLDYCKLMDTIWAKGGLLNDCLNTGEKTDKNLGTNPFNSRCCSSVLFVHKNEIIFTNLWKSSANNFFAWRDYQILRSSHQSCLIKKRLPKSFVKFTGKQLYQGLFFIRLQPQACNFIKKRGSGTGVSM